MNSASISDCGKYRYMLTREWSMDLKPKRLTWLMLNPSTADDVRDDPTIRRCIGFSKARGYGALAVINLFAYRATNPKELLAVADPSGPDAQMAHDLAIMGETVLACGVPPKPLQAKARAILASIVAGCEARNAEYPGADPIKPLCLGTTAEGWPKHPLYLPFSSIVQSWSGFLS